MQSDRGRFAGQVAIVTGGGTGIGAATARRIAAEGGKVLVSGRREGPIAQVADEIGGAWLAGDAAHPGHAAAAVALAADRFGGIDVLVANAGIFVAGSIEEASPDDVQRAFRGNLESAANFGRAVIPRMRARGGGSIVLVASMAALTAGPHGAPYMISKAAMLGLARSITLDYGPDNIRCNTVCPGWVRTDMSQEGIGQLGAAKNLSVEQTVARITRYVPLRRMADPAELAATIAFFASRDACFVSGAVLVADGGASVLDAGTLGAIA